MKNGIRTSVKKEMSAVSKKEEKMNKKQHELDEMMQKLHYEKAKLKQSNSQLNINDAPKKIKVEKKSRVTKLFNRPTKTQTVTKINRNSEFKNWEFPELTLLENRTDIVKIDENEIRRKEIEIQEKLLQFRIEVEMLGYQV
ncbi:hypothetical protein HOG21_00275 [bacterium]|jgi:hypothetical protein|nr:hypothetical protein [bacterium]